ncbi:MAG: SPFH domain-containing protein [Anaeromyxobacter sp.]
MAQITRFGPVRHLRSDASAHVLLFRNGRLRREGRGLSFLFQAHSASIAEVPADDRELPLVVHARTADFQDVTVQGVLTYRVRDPRTLAARVDFTIDLGSGRPLRQPLEQLALIFGQRAEQHAAAWVAGADLRDVLAQGPEAVRGVVEAGLAGDASLQAMGLETVSVRVSSVKPVPDLEKALAAPTRESLQQVADQAAFARRALAVEKERAIQENELKNQNRAGPPQGGADQAAGAERAAHRRGEGGGGADRRRGRRPPDRHRQPGGGGARPGRGRRSGAPGPDRRRRLGPPDARAGRGGRGGPGALRADPHAGRAGPHGGGEGRAPGGADGAGGPGHRREAGEDRARHAGPGHAGAGAGGPARGRRQAAGGGVRPWALRSRGWWW